MINKQGGPDVDDPLARILEDIQRNPGSKNNPPPEPPLARGQQPAAPIPTPKPPPASAGRGKQRMLTIALDPGHGGEDPGAIGSSGLRGRTWCCASRAGSRR